MKSSEQMVRFTREALGISGSVSIDITPLTKRGSDRTFFRIKWNLTESAILISYDPGRIENTYYADLGNFLYHIHVPVPRLIRHDTANCLILMEDMGDEDLCSFRNAPWETRRTLYQKTLAATHRLHAFPEKDFPSGRVRLMEGFGPDLYRWERDYFRINFVSRVCGIELEQSLGQELEEELAGLAQRLAEAERCLVHRDLQSQNVMIRNREPFFIDFQGMRFGSPFYDLGSLLCDPYVTFSGKEIDELLAFYYGLSKKGLDWTTFQTCFWEASAQRLMQALGAYGFLGLNKGLKTFLDHIPAGLRNLRRAASCVSSLPRLLEVSGTCRRLIDEKRSL